MGFSNGIAEDNAVDVAWRGREEGGLSFLFPRCPASATIKGSALHVVFRRQGRSA